MSAGIPSLGERFKSHGDRVSWVFSTEDCTVFALETAPGFDVVSTSNVSDHVGLLPLLQSLRGCVVPTGHLLTQTLRWPSYSKNIHEYLHKNLLIDAEYLPSIIGWRCVGHEGDLAAIGGAFDSVITQYSQMMSADAKTQSEHNFVWKPAFVTNVPLQLSGNKAVEGMFKSLMSSYGSGSMLNSNPFLRSQMMSLLPIICRAYADDWEQLFSNCTERTPRSWILHVAFATLITRNYSSCLCSFRRTMFPRALKS